MAGCSQQSIEKVENLVEEVAVYKKMYENLLEEHLKEEKVLRVKRSKVETILASLISKYDNDVGEFHKNIEQHVEK